MWLPVILFGTKTIVENRVLGGWGWRWRGGTCIFETMIFVLALSQRYRQVLVIIRFNIVGGLAPHAKLRRILIQLYNTLQITPSNTFLTPMLSFPPLSQYLIYYPTKCTYMSSDIPKIEFIMYQIYIQLKNVLYHKYIVLLFRCQVSSWVVSKKVIFYDITESQKPTIIN